MSTTTTRALPLPGAGAGGRARAAADDPYAHRYLIALTVTLASVLELLDTSIVNVAIPHMMGTLGATLDQIAWVSTGYVVANVIVLPITGWLAARFGRRRYFAASIALFTVASFFCGNASTLGGLVFWRIVQGVGGGALLSTSQSILYEVFPREEFGTAMAIFGMGVMVGPTLGPTLGGYITDALSWPWIFYINVPLGMLALAMTLGFIRDSRFAQKIFAVDWLGLGLLIAGIGCLQTMLERGERLDWFDSGEVLLYAVVSAVSLVWFVWHELHTEHPIVDLRILKNRQFSAGITFAAMLGCCLYATVFVLPVYLQTLLGFTAEQTGFVILPGALASAVTMALMARLGSKVDGRLLVVTGVGIFLLSMWKHAHFTTQSGMGDFFWPLILRGVGLGLIFVPMTNLALAELPMDRIPNGTGLFNLTRQLGGSIGIAVTATLVARFRGGSFAALSNHVTIYGQATQERLAMITQALIAKGTPATVAPTEALAILNGQVMRQAAMLSYEKVFWLFGLGLALALPLLLLMRRARGQAGGGMAH
jgi:DHA2 family multidrug resistance protein